MSLGDRPGTGFGGRALWDGWFNFADPPISCPPLKARRYARDRNAIRFEDFFRDETAAPCRFERSA
jgi:hypothetical protein